MTCYAVLWIPTIVHKDLPEVITNSFTSNISDVEESPFYAEVKMQKNRDIDIYIGAEEKHLSHFITLEFINPSCNGMILYSYKKKEYGSGPDALKFTDKTFPESIYHIIKAFYHEHDFHEKPCDSTLCPFTSSKKINIQDNNNEALLHYLKCYEALMLNSVRYTRLLIRKIRTKTNNWEIADSKYKAISTLCLQARGYEVYLGSLYNSRYNTLCHIDCRVKKGQTQQRELRQRAFNIENAVKYLRAVEYEFTVKYQQLAALSAMEAAERNMAFTVKSARSSTRWAKISILVSFILGVGSIVYSVYIANQSSADLQLTKESLRTPINKLSTIVTEIHEQQEHIRESFPELKEIKAQENRLIRIERKIDDINKTLKKVQNTNVK